MKHLITPTSKQLIELTTESPLGSSITDDNLISQMAGCPDWESRYRIIMQLGKQLAPLPTEYQCASFEIHGCESVVWLAITKDQDRYYLVASSQARIVKGLIAAIVAALQGKTAAQLQSFDQHHYFALLGLEKHLTPSRSNGLASIIKVIKECAK